jgi:hypothetical protein
MQEQRAYFGNVHVVNNGYIEGVVVSDKVHDAYEDHEEGALQE